MTDWGEAPSYQVALDHSSKVKLDLVHSGFLPNLEKSVWVPTLVIDWLGFTINLFQGLLFIPGKKIKRVLSDINSILEAPRLGNSQPLQAESILLTWLLVTLPPS